MPKRNKPSARKKTAKKPAKKPKAQAPRPAQRTVDAPSVAYACGSVDPRYQTAPAGLVDIVSGIPAFAAALPRGRIVITVEPE